MRTTRLLLLPILAVFFLGTPPAIASQGSAAGRVALVDSGSRAYGYSADTGLWTPVDLEGPVSARKTGEFLGYIRSHQKLYAFNALIDRWFITSYAGLPSGEAVEGATAVFWSSNEAHAISTVWASWRAVTWGLTETPRGGGSAGSFAIVWTNRRAYAYNAANGQWDHELLPGPPLGGIASDGLGMVWTGSSVHAFDPSPGEWITTWLADPQGISADGSGQVGLIWSQSGAVAFAAPLAGWYPIEPGSPIEGATAAGSVAVLWTDQEAHAFSASSGSWTSFPLDLPAGAAEAIPDAQIGTQLSPNPVRAGEPFTIRVPASGRWSIDRIDCSGRRLDGTVVVADGVAESIVWTAPEPGIFWIRFSSGERVEARRIVVIP